MFLSIDNLIVSLKGGFAERLTYEKTASTDAATLETFLMTYRTILGARELFDILRLRYHVPGPAKQSQAYEKVRKRDRAM